MTPFARKVLPRLLTGLILAGVIGLRARISYASFTPEKTNFTTFWLSGRMLLEDKNPYNESQYLGEHDLYGIQWRPNKIFPYPLPLALLCIPLGLFPIRESYLFWLLISQIIVVYSIHSLLNRWKTREHDRLLIPLFAFLFFWGPLYLTLHTGSIGALALLLILSATLMLEKGKSLPAGVLLSLTMLKPPQGITLLILAGIWFLAKRDWKAILGMAVGGLGLVAIGMIQDPLWMGKFITAGQAVMERTQGVHSNVWGFAYLACGGAAGCSTLAGGLGSLVLLGLAGYFLWKNHASMTPWEAMDIIILAGFVSTLYLWAYDQLPYILPVVWIVGTIVQKRKSYLPSFLFLIILVTYSFFAMGQLAVSGRDLWSLGNTLIVLGMLMMATKMKEKAS